MQQSDSYNMQPSSCKYTLTEWKTVWILIRWPHQMAPDLDVQCFQKQQINLGLAGQGLRKDNIFLACFYHTSAPAKLKKDKTTTTIMEREIN